MATKLLHQKKCERAKPRAKFYRLTDGDGLCLAVYPNGSKAWQWRYRLNGRPTTMNLGGFPEWGLEKARAEHTKHREVLKSGRDPKQAKLLAKVANQKASAETFGAIAAEWLDHNKHEIADVTHERNEGIVRRILLPKLGPLPLREIDATVLLPALRAAEQDGLLMSARRARILASQIFGYAIASGRAATNPALGISKALRKRPKTEHHAALKADKIGEFLTALDSGKGASPVTATALRLMLYTGLRDGSLRGAKWSEIDLNAAKWTVPAERMKRREQHSVPLPKQALRALKQLARLTDRGATSYVFASTGKQGFLAENTLRVALHRMGFDVTAHGFRSLLTDELYKAGFRSEWIERQLHHKDANEVRAAYLRDDFYEQRVGMIQWWADNCTALQKGKKRPALPSNVLPLPVKRTA